MKRNLLFLATAAAILLGACTKKDYKDLSKAIITPASPVSDSIPLKGTIKGTMLAGKTYTVAGDVYINAGDTLTLQAGVTVQFTGPYGLGVKGSLLSLGTKDHPNYFTFRGATKTDQPGYPVKNDSAYKGRWIGVVGAPTSPMMIFKWTHIEFGGVAIPDTSGIKQIYANPYPMFFQNPAGILVF